VGRGTPDLAAVARRIRRLNLIADVGRDDGVPIYPWFQRLADPRDRTGSKPT